MKRIATFLFLLAFLPLLWTGCKDKCPGLQSEYEPNQYVVVFDDCISLDSISIIINSLEADGDAVIGMCMCDRIFLMETQVDLNQREAVAKSKTGQSGDVGKNYAIAVVPVDPVNFNDNIGQDTFEPVLLDPAKRVIKVAIVDTGIDYRNPSIQERMWYNEGEFAKSSHFDDDENCLEDDIYGYNFNDTGPASPQDDFGHGTHVAGIISTNAPNITNSMGDGVFSPDPFPVDVDLRLMALKFTQQENGNLFDALCAIHYAINKGADIINLSWGYYGEMDDAFYATMKRAAANDILIVAAAGNDCINTDNCQHWPNNFAAKLGNVISVAALDGSYNSLANFSNYGPNSVLIAAPGKDISSTFLIESGTPCINLPQPGGDFCQSMTGTSMAAPFVSRAAALIKANEPGLSAIEIRDCILNNIDDIGETKINSEGKLGNDATCI